MAVSLAVLLRAWRERALLSQEQLAARTGLGGRTIRRLESKDSHRPHGQSVRLLADALRLTDGSARSSSPRRAVTVTPRGERPGTCRPMCPALSGAVGALRLWTGRWPSRPLPATSRDTVEVALPSRAAITVNDSPPRMPRLVSSRSTRVSRPDRGCQASDRSGTGQRRSAPVQRQSAELGFVEYQERCAGPRAWPFRPRAGRRATNTPHSRATTLRRDG
jgi:hypothetical protein